MSQRYKSRLYLCTPSILIRTAQHGLGDAYSYYIDCVQLYNLSAVCLSDMLQGGMILQS